MIFNDLSFTKGLANQCKWSKHLIKDMQLVVKNSKWRFMLYCFCVNYYECSLIVVEVYNIHTYIAMYTVYLYNAHCVLSFERYLGVKQTSCSCSYCSKRVSVHTQLVYLGLVRIVGNNRYHHKTDWSLVAGGGHLSDVKGFLQPSATASHSQ